MLNVVRVCVCRCLWWAQFGSVEDKLSWSIGSNTELLHHYSQYCITTHYTLPSLPNTVSPLSAPHHHSQHCITTVNMHYHSSLHYCITTPNTAALQSTCTTTPHYITASPPPTLQHYSQHALPLLITLLHHHPQHCSTTVNMHYHSSLHYCITTSNTVLPSQHYLYHHHPLFIFHYHIADRWSDCVILSILSILSMTKEKWYFDSLSLPIVWLMCME